MENTQHENDNNLPQEIDFLKYNGLRCQYQNSVTMRAATSFNFTQQGNEKGIEIQFGQGQVFWSCKRGTDLFDFDALLEYCIPNIDLEQINRPIARWWEQELYRLLSKCKKHKSRMKALAGFCERIGKRYPKKQDIHLQNRSTQSLLIQLEKTISDKMGLIKQQQVSRKKSGSSAFTEVSA